MWRQRDRYRSWGKGVLWISAFAILLACGYVIYTLFSVYWGK